MPRAKRTPVSTIPELDQALVDKGKAIKKRKRDYIKAKGNAIRVSKGRAGAEDYLNLAQQEDAMIAAVDFRTDMHRLKPLLEKLVEEKFDPGSFFGAVSKFAAAELASVAFTGEKEKNRLDALKHLLALGGHNATQKHEISRIDSNTEKEALMSIVRGAKKDLLAEGIEIVDDTEDYDK